MSRAWNAAVALVECRLATGRTHQIRVHLATAGHPIVGIRCICAGCRRRRGGCRRACAGPLLDFPRQALHAAVLGLPTPAGGVALRFETSAAI